MLCSSSQVLWHRSCYGASLAHATCGAKADLPHTSSGLAALCVQCFYACE